MAVRILHKRSAVEFKSATGAQLEYGELALNYHESGPYLQCKDAAGEIVQLGGVYIGSSAPGNELKGAWWLRDTDYTLFLYDGTRWVSIAGGGGGGGTGDITAVIGGDGIEATEAAGIVTVEVDLASDSHGLSIVGGKLQADVATDSALGTVRVGDGLDIDANGILSVDGKEIDAGIDLEYVPDGNNDAEITNTAGDNATVPIAIQANSNATPTPTVGVAGLFTGLEKEKLAGIEDGAQVNGAPVTISETAPADPADGDLWWADSDVDDGGGRLYTWTGDEWVDVSIPGGALTQAEGDTRYLSRMSDDTAAGEITFKGLTTHEDGVQVTGGDPSQINNGLNYQNGLHFTEKGVDCAQVVDGTFYADGPGNSNAGNCSKLVTNGHLEPKADGTASVIVVNNYTGLTGSAVDYSFNSASFDTSGGGTVTNQLIAYDTATNLENVAPTNIGFRSTLRPVTGKDNYNFYAEGTAPNYFEGLTEHASGVKVTGGSLNDAQMYAASPGGSGFPGSISFAVDSGDGSTQNRRLFIGPFGTIFQPRQVAPSISSGSNTGYSFQHKINASGAVESLNGITLNFTADCKNQTIDEVTLVNVSEANISNSSNVQEVSGVKVTNSILNTSSNTAAYRAEIDKGNDTNYNFYASGNAPNYFRGVSDFSPNPDINPYLGTLNAAGDYLTISAQRLASAAAGGFSSYTYSATRSHAGINVLRANPNVDKGNSQDNFINFYFVDDNAGKAQKDFYGSIRADGSGGIVIDTASDYRVKENVVNLSSATEAIKSLRPVNYNYTWAPGKTRPGFIAHELQEIVPVAVTGEKDATEAIGTLLDWDGTELETGVTEPSAEELTYTEEVETDGVTQMVTRTRSWTQTGTRDLLQGVDQTKLIPLLTKALQEALERIDALEAQLNP